MADGDDLAPLPDSDGEGAGAMAQNGVGAVVERLKGWNDTAPTTRRGGWRVARLTAHWAAGC